MYSGLWSMMLLDPSKVISSPLFPNGMIRATLMGAVPYDPLRKPFCLCQGASLPPWLSLYGSVYRSSSQHLCLSEVSPAKRGESILEERHGARRHALVEREVLQPRGESPQWGNRLLYETCFAAARVLPLRSPAHRQNRPPHNTLNSNSAGAMLGSHGRGRRTEQAHTDPLRTNVRASYPSNRAAMRR